MEYQTTINALIVSAIAAGVYHTLIGPDHYLPFVALGKARGWSYSKTVLATSHASDSLTLVWALIPAVFDCLSLEI